MNPLKRAAGWAAVTLAWPTLATAQFIEIDPVPLPPIPIVMHSDVVESDHRLVCWVQNLGATDKSVQVELVDPMGVPTTVQQVIVPADGAAKAEEAPARGSIARYCRVSFTVPIQPGGTFGTGALDPHRIRGHLTGTFKGAGNTAPARAESPLRLSTPGSELSVITQQLRSLALNLQATEDALETALEGQQATLEALQIVLQTVANTTNDLVRKPRPAFCPAFQCEEQLTGGNEWDGFTCNPRPLLPCYPYGCDPGDGKCRSECVTSADCAGGAACSSEGQCVPSESQCSDNITVQSADGSLVNCAPYTCELGVCKAVCSANSDCAPGAVCQAGRCVVAQ